MGSTATVPPPEIDLPPVAGEGDFYEWADSPSADQVVPKPNSVSAPTASGIWGAISRNRWLIAPALAAMLALLVLGSPLTTDRPGFLDVVVEKIEPRAAFLMVDDFESGIGNVWNPRQALVRDDSGVVRVAGLTLHRDTMGLVSYRMDFDAKITSGAVGWVLGAVDSENYHAYKLVKPRAGSTDSYRLLRYRVVGGKAEAPESVVPGAALKLNEDDFNRISVRIREGRITTLINGHGVDYWSLPQWNAGGIGFFADKGELSLIRYVTVYCNQDLWGWSLEATLKAIRTIEDFLYGPVYASRSSTPAKNL